MLQEPGRKCTAEIDSLAPSPFYEKAASGNPGVAFYFETLDVEKTSGFTGDRKIFRMRKTFMILYEMV